MREHLAIVRLYLVLLSRKWLVALIRFFPAKVGNSLLFIGIAVKRLALERVVFELLWSHLVVHGQLRRRGRGPFLESGFGKQRFCSSHLVACAAHSKG
jgi:hypothetical protein